MTDLKLTGVSTAEEMLLGSRKDEREDGEAGRWGLSIGQPAQHRHGKCHKSEVMSLAALTSRVDDDGTFRVDQPCRCGCGVKVEEDGLGAKTAGKK